MRTMNLLLAGINTVFGAIQVPFFPRTFNIVAASFSFSVALYFVICAAISRD